MKKIIQNVTVLKTKRTDTQSFVAIKADKATQALTNIKVVTCDNCKDIWIYPISKCSCGCTTLIDTSILKVEYARNSPGLICNRCHEVTHIDELDILEGGKVICHACNDKS